MEYERFISINLLCTGIVKEIICGDNEAICFKGVPTLDGYAKGGEINEY